MIVNFVMEPERIVGVYTIEVLLYFVFFFILVGLASCAYPCDTTSQYLEGYRNCLNLDTTSTGNLSTITRSLYFRLISGRNITTDLPLSDPVRGDSEGLLACG